MEKDLDKLISMLMQFKRSAAQLQACPLDEKIGTMLQFHVLFFLEKNPNAALSEISQYACGSPSSTTQLINRLNKADLVTREADTKDRRIIRHTLTKEGLKRLHELKEEKTNQAKKLFSKLDKADIKTLITIMEKLLHNLEESK